MFLNNNKINGLDINRCSFVYVFYLLMILLLMLSSITQSHELNDLKMTQIVDAKQNIEIKNAEARNPKQHGCMTHQKKLSQISQKIKKLTRIHHQPKYSIVKLLYTNLSKLGQSNQLNRCVQNYENNKSAFGKNRYDDFEIIPSINIYEGQSIGYPAIIRICQKYFTLGGHKIFQFHDRCQIQSPSKISKKHLNKCYKHFISSVRNQYTYFAQIEWAKQEGQQNQLKGNTTIHVKKLISKNKKISLQHNQVPPIQIPLMYGQVTGFLNSFSLSLKLFAFSTSFGYVFFYRMDGKLESINKFGSYSSTLQQLHKPMIDNKLSGIRLVKLNNNIAVYTPSCNKHSYIYTISTNGKNSTIKKYTIPQQCASKNQQIMSNQNQKQIQLKFNDNNWNQFYMKVGSKVYVYNQQTAHTINYNEPVKSQHQAKSKQTQIQYENLPKAWYPLLHEQTNFHIAGTMLILQSQIRRSKKGESSEQQVFRYYCNLTQGTPQQFKLPSNFCSQSSGSSQSKQSIGVSAQSLGSHIVCTLCSTEYSYAYQCYSLTAGVDPNSIVGSYNSDLGFTDYSKFRVPLVFLSLAIVIFISVTRSKKSEQKSDSEQKEQELFMKQLQMRDKNLYQELKRVKNSPTRQPNVGATHQKSGLAKTNINMQYKSKDPNLASWNKNNNPNLYSRMGQSSFNNKKKS